MFELFAQPIGWTREFFLAFGTFGLLVWTIIKIMAVALPITIAVAFFVLFERKVIGWMHVRHGPAYIGGVFGVGIIQTFADVFKLLFKEVVTPTASHKFLYRLAPIITLAPALAAWAVVPFEDGIALSNANAGLLYLLAMTSMGVYGIILAGWASNSKYAFLGAMRSAAQVVSYEIAMGFALVGVIVAAAASTSPTSSTPRRAAAACSTGSGCRCSRCSSSTSSPAWPRPTARRSTWPRASRRSWPGTWSSIPGARSRCSSWPNTRT